MNKIFLFLLTVLVVVACDDSDVVTPEPPIDKKPPVEGQVKELVTIDFGVAKKVGNIYEPIEFYMNIDKDTLHLSILDSYDSIVWTVPGLDGRFKVFSQDGGFVEIAYSWSNNFFLPGTYDTHLLCYKNDTVIRRDSVTVDIENKKDFLGYNWSEVNDSTQLDVEFMNHIYPNEVEWRMMYSATADVHYMILYPWPVHFESFDWGVTDDFKEKEGKLLYDYMCKLYDSPQYTESGKDSLQSSYKKLFANQRAGCTPKAIWITPTSRIVFLYNPDVMKDYSYFVLAEPNESLRLSRAKPMRQ